MRKIIQVYGLHKSPLGLPHEITGSTIYENYGYGIALMKVTEICSRVGFQNRHQRSLTMQFTSIVSLNHNVLKYFLSKSFDQIFF